MTALGPSAGNARRMPAHLVEELRYLEIAAARRTRTARPGAYTSRTRGDGFEFDQHHPYQPGDDVRRIDWNVTARLNAPFLRQTEAERELNVVIAADVSPSMAIGSMRYSKKEATIFAAASVLFSAAADGINAGLLAFSDRVLTWSPPRPASGRAWRMLEELQALAPTRSRTRLLPVVRQLASTLKPATIVVLVSDFMTDEDVFGSPELRMLAARDEVIAAFIEDGVEMALPPGHGFLRVRDPETRRDVVVALNERSRRAYVEAVAQRRQALVDGCYRLGIDFAFVRADRPVLEPLMDLFARRRLE